MVWARIDDAILDNPKIAKVGVYGFALHIAGITWCSRNLTDGLIPFARVQSLLPLNRVNIDRQNPLALEDGGSSISGDTGLDVHTIATKLVEAGLWADTDDGYEIHDFLEYNPSRVEVLAAREKTRGRVQKHRSRKRNGVTNDAVTALHPSGNGVSNAPVTPHPVPVPGTDPTGEGDPKDLTGSGDGMTPAAARPEFRNFEASFQAPPGPWPDDFRVDPETVSLAGTLGLTPTFEAASCADWHRANGKLVADPNAALRSWMRRSASMGDQRAPPGRAQYDKNRPPDRDPKLHRTAPETGTKQPKPMSKADTDAALEKMRKGIQ